ncbi:GntR family transcriptional regulator [Enterococcus sp. AZ126]|uniref:GntR family transcriptional regulator n=1 Tax=Enterococcus sp. AZ126 TaxID=2774635 RepID=UPI003F296128
MNLNSKYMKVYIDTKHKITNDHYLVGDKLPSGKDLALLYQCSKLTVKKGLDLLVKEGILRSRSGYGTEVLRKPMDTTHVFGPNAGLLNIIGEEHVTSKIHSFSIEIPSKKIAKLLKVSNKDYVYNIVRSRYIDHKPYSIEQTFMPLSIIPGLQPKHLEKSVYNYITEELNLTILTSHLWIKGDLATEMDKRFLSVEDGFFMMEVEKIVSLESGKPFEYSVTRHLYSDFTFEAIFVQNH